MLCNILLIFSVLSTYPMVVRCLQKNDFADVVIAVDSANLQSFPSALEAFFRSIAKHVKPISPDDIRVSVVHYSTTVRVALPLKNGTNPSAIEGVRFENNERSDPMQLEKIASAVREEALKQDLGKREHAPSVVVILARNELTSKDYYTLWKIRAQENAKKISQEMTADIILIVNNYSSTQYLSYFHASAEQSATDMDHFTQDERSVFDYLSQQVFVRLQSALNTCHFTESRSGPCQYKKNNCVAIFNRQPEQRTPSKYVRYCPQSGCAKCYDAEDCERECASATVWTTCVQDQCHLPGCRIRRPKDDNEETVLTYERCIQFENYTKLATPCDPTCNPTESTGSTGKSRGTTRGRPGPDGKKNGTVSGQPSGLLKCGGGTGIEMCLPLWLALVVAVGSTFLVLIAVCIQRAVFKRRLDTEKRRLLETISTSMKKSQSGYDPSAVPTGSMKPRPGETREDSKLQASFTSNLRTARSASGLTKQESLIKSDLGMKSGSKPATVSAVKPVVMVESKSKSKADGLGGSSEMGISSVDKPPSLTTRTIDELIKQEYKKSGCKPATLRSKVDAKPGRRTKGLRSELRSLSRQLTKRKDMKSTGYRE